jgi:uncharacterized membrane protein
MRRRLPTLAAALLLTLSAVASAQFEWLDVEQHVSIGPQGDVRIDDSRTLRALDGHFIEAFVCIEHDPAIRVTLLPGSGVVRAPRSGEALLQPCDRGTELVVRFSERISEARIRWIYQLDGTMQPYSDVVQWFWNLLQLDHPPIRGYRLSVRAPGPMEAPFDAFVMRYDNPEEPRVTLSDDRSELRVVFDQIPRGAGVEVRYLMDPALFSVSGTDPGLKALLADQLAFLEREAAAQSQRELLAHPLWGLFPLAALLYLGVGILRAYLAVGREPRSDVMRYPFEPPADLPPAAVTALLQQKFIAASMGPALLATIMELARRGALRFRGSGRELTLVMVPNADLSALESFEREVHSYLLRALATEKRTGHPNELSLRTLERYGQRHAQKFLSDWGPHVRKWVEGFMGGPLTTDESRAAARRWMLRAAVAVGLAVAGALVTSGLALAAMLMGAVGAALLLLVAATALPAWRPAVALQVAQWQGFRRTLGSHTRMRDAPEDFFQLWDRYYVYAAALGVAERYLRTLQRVASDRRLDQRQLAAQAGWLSAQPLSDLRSVNQSLSSIMSSLARSGAAASSGGSSSGGGAGGSGGGSSGGR